MKKLNNLKHLLTGYRKFLLAAVFFFVSLGLLFAEYISGTEWLKQNQLMLAAFFATNVGEHLINVGKEWMKNKVAETQMKIIKGDK